MTNEELMQEELNLESSYRQDGYELSYIKLLFNFALREKLNFRLTKFKI